MGEAILEDRLGKPPLCQEEFESVTNCGPHAGLPLRRPEFMSCGWLLFFFLFFLSSSSLSPPPPSYTIFLSSFSVAVWLGRGTTNTWLDLGTETTWIYTPKVLGYVQDEPHSLGLKYTLSFWMRAARGLPLPRAYIIPLLETNNNKKKSWVFVNAISL